VFTEMPTTLNFHENGHSQGGKKAKLMNAVVTNLVTVEGPRAKFHLTTLLVEGKIRDVNGA
jgi:hypothetical protein